MHRFAPLVLLSVVLPAGASAATANCAPRDVVIERLSDHYGEEPQAIGLIAGQQVMELWGAAETGTWTIIITLADGRSCIATSGNGLENIRGQAARKGAPA